MKLDELLTKITPLPWKMDDYERVKSGTDTVPLVGFSLSMLNSGQPQANSLYVHHCASVLPELVEALRMALKQEDNWKVVGWNVLSRASKVQTP